MTDRILKALMVLFLLVGIFCLLGMLVPMTLSLWTDYLKCGDASGCEFKQHD